MDVPIITMEVKAAKKAYTDYHRLVLERRVERRQELREKGRALGKTLRMLKSERTRLEREDEELMAAYKALANNQRVISLPQVMKAAGVQPNTHLPALALAGAAWKDCFFQVDSGAAFYSEERWIPWRQRAAGGTAVIRLSRQVFPAETTDESWRANYKMPGYPVKAIVPSIPPPLRPNNVEKYFILWDAVWTPAPPVDPLLLKRIGRDIFVVVAQWDLTPLERSVLEGRLGS
jgi:hypothetical protein